MSDDHNAEQPVEVQSRPERLPEQQPQLPVPTSAARRKRRIKQRDCIEWVEFGIGLLEVALTITITILIVYEFFYAKHEDELASRAPEIRFSQNTFSVQVVPREIIQHPMELVTPEIGIVFNQGHAALINGSVVAFTDQQDVKITCTEQTTVCKTHFEPGYVLPGVDFDLGTLAVRRGAQIKFTVAYMSNHKPFKVRLSVSGDNIELYKITDLPFDSTMSPPPPEK
jgi:hypothetical protein